MTALALLKLRKAPEFYTLVIGPPPNINHFCRQDTEATYRFVTELIIAYLHFMPFPGGLYLAHSAPTKNTILIASFKAIFSIFPSTISHKAMLEFDGDTDRVIRRRAEVLSWFSLMPNIVSRLLQPVVVPNEERVSSGFEAIKV